MAPPRASHRRQEAPTYHRERSRFILGWASVCPTGNGSGTLTLGDSGLPWKGHTWPTRSLPGETAQRNPMLLLRFVGLLLRFAARTLFQLLFQPPPRSTLLATHPHVRRPDVRGR